MRDVTAVGVGSTRYDMWRDKTQTELFAEAAMDAMKDADVEAKEIEALYYANCQGAYGWTQLHAGPIMANVLGIGYIPTTRMENACASGSVAFRHAYMAVAAGFYDIVMVAGSETVSTMTTPRATEAFAFGSDRLYEVCAGVTFPGFYALIANAHIHKYGTTREQLAAVAVKNHKNGAKNPKAQFQKEVTMERVINSPMIADPLRLFDCCPFSDGASAVILASGEQAKRFDTPIYIIGSGQASDYTALHDRKDLTTLAAASYAAEQAYKQAGIGSKDLDLAEVHDCFTIAEIIATEDLGIFKRGQAGVAVLEGATQIDGKIPVNSSGGLKAKGHPVAATGIGQIIEIVEQLRGESGKRQVSIKRGIGLAHNVGGSGGTATVHILKRR